MIALGTANLALGLAMSMGAISWIDAREDAKAKVRAEQQSVHAEAKEIAYLYGEVVRIEGAKDAAEAAEVLDLMRRRLGPSPKGRRLDAMCLAQAVHTTYGRLQAVRDARAREVGVDGTPLTAQGISARIAEYDTTRETAAAGVAAYGEALQAHAACLAKGGRDATTDQAHIHDLAEQRDVLGGVETSSSRGREVLEVLRRSPHKDMGGKVVFAREADLLAYTTAVDAHHAAQAAERLLWKKVADGP